MILFKNDLGYPKPVMLSRPFLPCDLLTLEFTYWSLAHRWNHIYLFNEWMGRSEQIIMQFTLGDYHLTLCCGIF